MLNYSLTQKVFSSHSDFTQAIEAVKNKVITTNEVKIMLNASIIRLYNDIVSHFFGGEKVDSENIYKRESMSEYLNEFQPNFMHLFPILTDNKLIGVCGRGYTLDSERLTQSKSDYETMLNIMFNKGIIF